MEDGYNNIIINYFDTSVQRKYSFDNENWYEYEDKKIKLEIGKTIYIKGIDKNEKETEIISYTASLPSDALPKTAYDNNMSSGYKGASYKDTYKFFDVSSEMRGKDIMIKYGGDTNAYYLTSINSSGTATNLSTKSSATGELHYTIPTDSVKLRIKTYYEKPIFYEITEYSRPTIKVENTYPILTKDGIKVEHLININYFDTSVQRKYSFDNENWYEYENEKVKLPLDKTIYIKGIDKNNKETEVLSYTSVLPSDALPKAAYDNNMSTSYRGASYKDTYKYFSVSNEMQGKNMIMKYGGKINAYSLSSINSSGKTTSLSIKTNSNGELHYTIPTDSVKLQIKTYYDYPYFYEIIPS